MTSEHEQEKKNQRIAMLTTAGVTALVVLLLFIVIAWRAPDPPLPEYGIELNFGTDQAGSGEVQPRTPVGDQGTSPEAPQESAQQEAEQPAEVEADPQPTEAAATQEVIASKVESPVSVKEEKKETKPAEKPDEKKPEVKKEEPKKEEVKPKVNNDALFKPKTDGNAQSNEAKSGESGSQGDDRNAAGDKGNPQGSLDSRAQFGKPGGGDGGSKIKLDGFEWPPIREPNNLPDGSNGVYEFEVVVDRNGDITGIKTLRRGPSAEAERIFRQLISNIEFTPTGTNLPSESKGVITFTVRSK
ncbi:MAG: hypothetical protein HC859_09170 [Bacteroidia bacterium]|nr:hypothetical protein [Bacteroidia bacterium]